MEKIFNYNDVSSISMCSWRYCLFRYSDDFKFVKVKMKKLWQKIKSLFDDGYTHEEGYLPYKISDRVKFRDDYSGFTLNLANPEVQKRIKKVLEYEKWELK